MKKLADIPMFESLGGNTSAHSVSVHNGMWSSLLGILGIGNRGGSVPIDDSVPPEVPGVDFSGLLPYVMRGVPYEDVPWSAVCKGFSAPSKADWDRFMNETFCSNIDAATEAFRNKFLGRIDYDVARKKIDWLDDSLAEFAEEEGLSDSEIREIYDRYMDYCYNECICPDTRTGKDISNMNLYDLWGVARYYDCNFPYNTTIPDDIRQILRTSFGGVDSLFPNMTDEEREILSSNVDKFIEDDLVSRDVKVDGSKYPNYRSRFDAPYNIGYAYEKIKKRANTP